MKKCTNCETEKEVGEFYSNGKGGYRSRCKSCYSLYKSPKRKEVLRKYRENNNQSIKESAKRYRDSNKQKLKDSFKEYRKRTENKAGKRYRSRNKGRYSYYAAKRRAAKLKATPKWVDWDKIRLIYQKAKELSDLLGITLEVDHVIPLQGKDVCGLHTWDNLQLLESSINYSKGNKVLVYNKDKL